MRLRRETGDFQIVIKPGEEVGTYEVNSIRPGLSAEDLMGEVVIVKTASGANGLDAIISVAPVEAGIRALTASQYQLVYNPATGGISVTISSQGAHPVSG